MLADYRNVIHHYPLTVGEYAIAADAQGRVNTLYREFQMTVAQMVAEFGRSKCSVAVQNLFDNGHLEQWVTLMQAIEPRTDRESGRQDARNMPWRLIYFEPAAGADAILRESGYRSFPVLCPHWAAAGGDVYGHSPAMEELGDIKQL